ncbi:MAG: ferric reductase-like transmembrane domain-containing protein [Cytophagales bacterium]|nr:ferric reductase-like transmembrane domain-containing protein [Cytophagales bacterium]
MSIGYQPVLWTKQKKKYDLILGAGYLLYLGLYFGFFWWHNPEGTLETCLIRSTGTLAMCMLSIILCIGPLCRLDARFLPLLYNRRHFGVSMFMVALFHGLLSLIHFHSQGNVNLFYSLFASNMSYGSFLNFPFQVFGFFALLILFLMASTSHDFWLNNLSPRVWKSLHMMVYLAFFSVALHVSLGALQQEKSPYLAAWVLLTAMIVSVLHLLASIRESRRDGVGPVPENNWLRVGTVEEIQEKRARIVNVRGERVAVFRYDGKLSAVSNVCKHQNGPIGEGKIVDGCITCPWHGYQYLPADGCSPPPFNEKLATYRVKIEGNTVFVENHAQPEGTSLEPAKLPTDEK